MRRDEVERIRKAIAVAERFADPRCLQLQQIDDDLGFPTGTSSHLLKYARKLGLITYRADIPMPRDKSLELQLARRFGPAKVIAVETHHEALGPVPKRKGAYAADDLLHERLGRAAAQLVAKKLGTLEILGLGAGRAVFHAGRSLILLPGSREKGRKTTVMALHGRMDRRVWRRTTLFPRQAIDAVRVTHVMATALPEATELALHLPLIQENLRSVREKFTGDAWFLSRHEWKQRPPSLVLVGMGVMGDPPVPGGGAGSGGGEPEIWPEVPGPIRSELRKVRTICRRFSEKHNYIPVSDICDRLFWVPGRDEEPDMRARAKPLIQKINDRVMGVETGLPPGPSEVRPSVRYPLGGSLDQAKRVVVVAGGALKVKGLAHLLNHRRPRGRRFMDVLITDTATARELLEHS
jgi:DNA-binding transcriptional regulator LsrR (DeoR family)